MEQLRTIKQHFCAKHRPWRLYQNVPPLFRPFTISLADTLLAEKYRCFKRR